ncbi:metallophosphoesterase (TIGR03767 family) [Marmoricola sp. OAE513]|uniref:TIGR03767 family metallophosphoesterase n=1 Tax=Marmoricola sp. OAE513 TaxID=2817894 RepID=UPI001AE72927
MVTLTRRRVLQAGATSGALAIWPTALLFDWPRLQGRPVFSAGTTLESTIGMRAGPAYRQLRLREGEAAELREDLARGRRGREDRREGVGVLVQVSDLHVTDAQHPLRFEYLDRINQVGHRPGEFLGLHGTNALVSRINGLDGGPWTGRRIDAVVSTGDNTDNQSRNELDWLLGVLAGGVVRADSGSLDGYEGVAASGHREYWQPESTRRDAFKDRGFPVVHGLLGAATRPFIAPGLDVPWVLTMGNHDDVAGGMLGNRQYVEDWSLGDRKIFSSHGDVTYRLASMLKGVRAGDDAREMLASIVSSGRTRTVHADPRRAPFTGADYLAALRDPRYVGAGPVGHGYAEDADPDHLYFTYRASELVTVISLDTTNQAGGAEGSIGSGQLAWLERQLTTLTDQYVVVLSHHPSGSMRNLAEDPRFPGEQRHGDDELRRVLHRHPQVVAWVNGHTHRNDITPHRHDEAKRSFWEINSASHTDAPQQARVIEVARNGDGTISLFTTMIDADAPLVADPDDLSPAGLASYYRELAFNDRPWHARAGRRRDRNTELLLRDPLPA